MVDYQIEMSVNNIAYDITETLMERSAITESWWQEDNRFEMSAYLQNHRADLCQIFEEDGLQKKS